MQNRHGCGIICCHGCGTARASAYRLPNLWMWMQGAGKRRRLQRQCPERLQKSKHGTNQSIAFQAHGNMCVIASGWGWELICAVWRRRVKQQGAGQRERKSNPIVTSHAFVLLLRQSSSASKIARPKRQLCSKSFICMGPPSF